MYEICRLLAAPKKARKPRKAPQPGAKAGAKVKIYGHDGVILGRHENGQWWNIRFDDGREGGFGRDQFQVVK